LDNELQEIATKYARNRYQQGVRKRQHTTNLKEFKNILTTKYVIEILTDRKYKRFSFLPTRFCPVGQFEIKINYFT